MAAHPYIADVPEFEKTFEGGRTFVLVSYEAFNAGGIIGSEYNGIAVLDPDNREVVLDAHLQGAGSMRRAVEFERLKAMDWKEFSAFAKAHPRYRGITADINAGGPPATGNHINQAIALGKPVASTGPVILPADLLELDASSEAEVKFDQKTRDEMIVFLASHQGYHPMNSNNGGYVIAWNIKVRGNVDMTGSNDGKNPIDSRFDKKWAKYAEANSQELYDTACEDELRTFSDGEFTSFKGDDTGDYKFYTNGRSGGYLVLSEFEGLSPPGGGWAMCPMAFADKTDYIEWLKELPDDKLVDLYVLVTSVDFSVKNPHESISYQIGFQRNVMEEEWGNEMKAKEARKAEKAAKKAAAPAA